MLYVDQQGLIKCDLRTSWLDVSFNLTKIITGFLLSDQFWNIKLDNIPLNIITYVFMLVLLYTNSYALGFKTEIMVNSDI